MNRETRIGEEEKDWWERKLHGEETISGRVGIMGGKKRGIVGGR